MNRVCLTGRAVAKPELRKNNMGGSICRFTLASQRNYKNSNGEYETDFIPCISFNKRAETMAQYIEKGDMIGVTGRIATGSYTAQDGSKRYTTDVVVDGFDFLQTKKKEETTNAETDQEEDAFADFGDKVVVDDNFLE